MQTQKEIIYYDIPNDLQIDVEFIRNLQLDPNDTIFYYIHQFGLYIEPNIRLMNEMQERGYFVIDDRSLTLPVQTYREFGNATAYSFYKLVGIPFGGEVRTTFHHATQPGVLGDINSELMKKMQYNFRFYTNPFVPLMPPHPFRIYNRLFAKFVDYRGLVAKCWSDVPAVIPSKVGNKLDGIDFDGITRRRIEIARILYSGLNPDILLPLGIDNFAHQSMMAFPILVNDPFQTHKLLLRRGIFTFRFTKIWWWDPTKDYCDLYKRNLLLPAHHGLRDSDVHRIIERVNEITC